jgi:hypothetical protein|tara:strand:- start:928 stop:1305 length:378 start_codon:yes stop_codon:yes gene_type:complete
MKYFFKQRWKHILAWALILVIIIIALKMEVDGKIVVFVTLILGFFTQIFAGFGALIAMVPWIGPFIIKVFTIPFFWLLNAMGYFVSIIAIKKGYSKQLTRSRVLTVALLFGIIIGYVLGHIIPLR